MGGSPTRGAFTYTGRAFPQLTGRWFPSVAAFCRAANLSPAMVYNRVHEGWPLIKALDVPRIEISQSHGRIYQVTRLTTGQHYIGLTIVSIAARWRQHVRGAARRGSPLARAIDDDGPENFVVELIEDDIAAEVLPDRERYWIATLGTIWPAGLNRHPGGGMGGGGRHEVEHEGETFRSVGEAAAELAGRHGLTPGAAHQRLRGGKSLDAPLKVVRTCGLGVAGSFLWSRWRAMRNNRASELGTEWQGWERFACDLATLRRTDRMVRIDRSKPWGPDNFVIHRDTYIDHPKVGSVHWTRWRSLLRDADDPGHRGVVEEWRDFNRFEADIATGHTPGAVLVPLDWWRPWGPENFRWGNQADLSRLIGRHGRKHVKHGDYRSRTYKRWASMHNDARRKGTRVEPEWNEYACFRATVGDGVERGLVLIRPDRSRAFGPNNFKLVSRDKYRESLGRFTHGNSGTPLHKRWLALRARATASGAGCDPSWNDFETFADDVGTARPGCDLERIDGMKPYGPGNFRWVDRDARRRAVEARQAAKAESTARKREAQAVTVRGVTYRGLYALAEAYGAPAATVCLRVRSGMTPEEAVTTPNRNIARAKPTQVDGRDFLSMNAALRYVEERYGIRRNTIAMRLQSGLSLQEAARKPLRASKADSSAR